MAASSKYRHSNTATSNLLLVLGFLKARRKWWLTPIVVVLLLISLVIVLTQGSALAPFIYALF